ncbi:MAG: NADH-quinone oxidoreductase subunit A [Ilumatobacteraceae bacterium]
MLLVTLLAFGCVAVFLAWARQHNAYESSASQELPFLGGLEPDTHAWSRFHFRAYPMTLVFLAFEMEMMFMYPWAVVYVEEGGKALAEMGMFLALLGVGIVYAAREGAFRWQ